MITFRKAFRKLLPWWLTSGEGELVQYSLGVIMDAFVERARLGLLARFPQHAPEDALSAIGRDRKIVRGINEPSASYAERLLRYLDDHRVRGNPFALMQQLRAYCQADVRIRTVDASGNWFTLDRDGTRSVSIATGNWTWDGETGWSRFWVIINPTADGEPWAASVVGSPASWPSGGTVGTTATPDQVASVRSIVAQWKPAGTRCEWVIVAFDDASFDPSAPEPNGEWRYFGWSNPPTYEPVRLDSARYWRGVDGT